MALKLPYRMRLLVSVGFFMVLCSSVVSYNSSDCMSFYRRDIMETWRIPQGSGLCNIKTNCSDFNVTAHGKSLTVQNRYDQTSMESSYSSFTYFSGYNMSVLLNFGSEMPYLIFSTTEYSKSWYTCQKESKDGPLTIEKYYLYIAPEDIIIEGRGIARYAYGFYFVAAVLFITASIVLVSRFYIASVGYPTFLGGWILLTGIFEMNWISLPICVILIILLASGAVIYIARQPAETQTITAIWLNGLLSLLMLLRSSLAGSAISLVAGCFMLITYCCMRNSASDKVHNIPTTLLNSKIKEGNLFMLCWLVSIIPQVDLPLPLLLQRYINTDMSYPASQGGYKILLYGPGVPILVFLLGSMVFKYKQKFAEQCSVSLEISQDYFASPGAHLN